MRNNLLILIAVFVLTVSPAYVFAPSHPVEDISHPCENPVVSDDATFMTSGGLEQTCGEWRAERFDFIESQTQFVIPFAEFITEGTILVLAIVGIVGVITIIILRRVRG